MTDVLTVHSHFEDVAQLANGLVDRVEDGRIILYGPTDYDAGARIGFSVLLVDGTPVLEGTGTVDASVDGGEERAAEIRYDVVFSELEMDARSEVMFERIVMARASMVGEEIPETSTHEAVEEAAPEEEDQAAPEEAAADVDLDDVEDVVETAEDVEDVDLGDVADVADVADDELAADADVEAAVEPEAYAVEADVAEDVEDVEDAAEDVEAAGDVADAGDEYGDVEDVDAADFADDDGFDALAEDPGVVIVEGALAPPEQPAAPSGFEVARLAETGVSRQVYEATWWPEATPRPEPSPSTGAFAYDGSLPLPNRPPRPDLDPGHRVSPAPRPSADGTVEAAPVESAPETNDTYEDAGVADTFAADEAAEPAADEAATYDEAGAYEDVDAEEADVDMGDVADVDMGEVNDVDVADGEIEDVDFDEEDVAIDEG